MSGVEFHVQSLDARRLSFDMQAVPGNLQLELRRGIREAGDSAAQAVRESASWSSRIPGAVKVTPNAASGAGVSIEVDAVEAPEAAPLNNRGNAGTFRHPVYGNMNNWVEQAARPFFETTIDGRGVLIEERIRKVMDDVARTAGFFGN